MRGWGEFDEGRRENGRQEGETRFRDRGVNIEAIPGG